MNRSLIQTAALLGFLAVALGAFGAHALRERPGFNQPVWETAVHYQMFHAAALLFLGLIRPEEGLRHQKTIGWCFTGGVLVFSGSLYALAVSGQRLIGAITPLGGVLFLAGWILLAISAGSKGT